ncbi:MAG: hypothetical protein AMXMBFR33_37840 [Candidatus Xenobia bacterium]
MKLYYCNITCSRAPHIVLEELAIPFDLHHIDLRRGEGQSEDFLAINPIGAVPVLEIEPGRRLKEVQVILQYLADLQPEKKLAPEWGTVERYELMQWLSFLSTELHRNFYPVFFSSNMVSEQSAQQELSNYFRKRLELRWATISDQLRDRDYLMGDYSIADPYLYTIMIWAELVKIDLSRWPNLLKFRERMENRSAVQRVLEKETPVKA